MKNEKKCWVLWTKQVLSTRKREGEVLKDSVINKDLSSIAYMAVTNLDIGHSLEMVSTLQRIFHESAYILLPRSQSA